MGNGKTQSRTGSDSPVNGSCILVVDKDPITRKQLNTLLASAGYEAVGVGDAITARASCRDSKPALVLLETHPADDSDFGLMRWLLSEQQVPVIIVDDSGDTQKARHAARHGSYGFLTKPCTETQLIATVEIALLRHQLWQELQQRSKEMNQSLTSNRQISTAVGILMERHRISDTEAFEHLRGTARSQQRKLEELARETVAAARELNLPAGNKPDSRSDPPDRASRAKVDKPAE